MKKLVSFGVAIVLASCTAVETSPPPEVTPHVAPPPVATSASTSTVPAHEGPSDVPPSNLSLPCKQDSQCGLHRCNTKYGRCAYPCLADRDCLKGSECYLQAHAMATCIPKPP